MDLGAYLIIGGSVVANAMFIWQDVALRTPIPIKEVTGDIIGWRAFAVHRTLRVEISDDRPPRIQTGAQLISPITPNPHTFDLLGTNCLNKYSTRPTEANATTGFYVFRRKSSCVRYFSDVTTRDLVFGTVLCHGHVMRHTRDGWFDTSPEGFRAEKLEILSLYHRSRREDHRNELGAQVGWVEGIKHISEGQEMFPLNLKEKKQDG